VGEFNLNILPYSFGPKLAVLTKWLDSPTSTERD